MNQNNFYDDSVLKNYRYLYLNTIHNIDNYEITENDCHVGMAGFDNTNGAIDYHLLFNGEHLDSTLTENDAVREIRGYASLAFEELIKQLKTWSVFSSYSDFEEKYRDRFQDSVRTTLRSYFSGDITFDTLIEKLKPTISNEVFKNPEKENEFRERIKRSIDSLKTIYTNK